ncbi:outer membrane protein assembly factor BamA [Polymorphum gilvum]|uniref:outer membrane protein assembly factor BamA n=1 Tax=Polymorphum gilvum TaxID=991904 RepID=UPI001F582801|nr:outer membrane protein assembly factor BamA [Polymorphum gilvum]
MAVSTAEAAVASAIVVRGNARIEDETVISYLTISRGRSYSAADVDESLKALFATGLFEDVRITTQGGTLVVTVTENPVISRISFEGNKRVSDETLKGVVRTTERSMLTRSKVETDVQNILEAYRRTGRYRASVDPKIIDRGNNRVDLVFEINEGDKTGVERITFIGNNNFSDRRLREVIRTRQSGLLSWLRTTDTYDPDRLNADQELLRQFYYQHGYADFRIVAVSADLDREQNVFYVTFTLDEGEKYKIGDVEVQTSLSTVDPEALRRYLRTKSGDTYNSKRVEQTLEDLTLQVSEEGYAFAEVRPRALRDYENRTISLVYNIEEGPRAYVERINVRGNDRTREYVIRREFDLAEGDAFNRVLLDKAERRLRNLGFFKEVRVTTERGSAPDRVIINVTVEEQPTGEISFGVGYSTTDGIIGDVSLSEKNFLGRGQYVKIGAGGGTDTQSYEFVFREPFFMGRRIALDLEVYRRVYDANDYRSYDEETTGGGIGFTLPLREDELALKVFYNIYETKISDPKGIAKNLATCPGSGLSNAVCDSLGSSLTSLAGYALFYNTLDNNIDPSEGIFAKFQQEFAGLGGDAQFIRTTAEARAYREVLPDMGLVGSVALRGGHIQAIGSKRLRVSDQFMFGGDLVRGFENQGIGPRDMSTTNRDALGGRFYVAGSVETTFPFPVIPEEFGLSGALFADAGSLWDADKDLVNIVGANNVASNGFELRASVGAGIRWRSPFGPLRVDFAWPVMKEDSDKTQWFRLSGGTKF